MKIHKEIQQRTPEWFRLRAYNFTASEFDSFCLEPRSFSLNVKEIREELESLGIDHKKNSKKDDLIALLPDIEKHKKVSGGALTAILRKIQQGKIQRLRDKEEDQRTEWDNQQIAWQDEIDSAAERKMSFNIAVQRGIMLEPDARFFYENRTGHTVTEVAFVEHDSGGFGCSPDGLISCQKTGKWTHGLELKSPTAETHMAYLLDGGLPSEYEFQVHGSMAVTGLDRWDFMSYCPGEAPLLLTIERNDFTDRLEEGLQELVAEKRKIEARLATIWQEAHQRGKGAA